MMKASSFAALGLLSLTLAANAVVFYPDVEYEDLEEAVAAAAASTPDDDIWIVSDLDEVFPNIAYNGSVISNPFFPTVPINLPAQEFPVEFAGATIDGFRFRMLDEIPDINYDGEFGCTVAGEMTFANCQFVGVIFNSGACGVHGKRAFTVDGGVIGLYNCYFDNEEWAIGGCDGEGENPIADSYLKISDTYGITSVTVQNPTWGVSQGGYFANVSTSRILVDGDTNYALDVDFLSCVFPDDDFAAINVADATTATFEAVNTHADIKTVSGINHFNGGQFNGCTLQQNNGTGYYTGVTFTGSTLSAGASSPKIHATDCMFYGSVLELESNTTTASDITNCFFEGGDTRSKAITITGNAPNGVTCTMEHLTVVGYGTNAVMLAGTLPSIAIHSSILMNDNAQYEVDWTTGYVTALDLDDLDVDGGTAALNGGGFQFGTVLDVDPMFLNINYTEGGPIPYTLHWKSPVQDLVAGETDFDETLGDLGWRPQYTPAELSSIPSGTPLERGHYEITDTRVLSGNNLIIQDGTVFKVSGSKQFTIRTTAGPLAIGDIDGARTSFVGYANNRATRIVIQGYGYTASTELGGLFFNNCPSADIRFAHLGGAELTRYYSGNSEQINYAATAEFQNIRGCELIINYCSDVLVKGFQFWNSPLPDDNKFHDLLIAQGDATVAWNTFETSLNTQWYAPLIVASTTTATIANNTFDGTNGGEQYLCYQSSGLSSYINNQFQDIFHTPFASMYSTVKMDENAGNRFIADDSGTDESLLHVHSGMMEMYCGYNRYINDDAEYGTIPFVTHTGGAGTSREWSKNFWGFDTDEPIPCDELNGDYIQQTDGYVPWWADASNCILDFEPQYYFCPDEDEALELYTIGYDYLVDEDWLSAIWHFKELIRIYPKYTDTPDATEYLKSMGQKDPDNLTPAKSGLLQGAASAYAVDDEWLSATQFCYAQCVEAYFGDRVLAKEVLDSCVTYGNAIVKDVATLALLEIDTYPTQGGNEAVGDQAALQRSVERELAAIQALVAWRPGAQAEEEVAVLPSDFRLGRIYPNPFNPRTTVELDVARDGNIRVTVVNLLGQQVAVLQEGQVSAGTHRLSFDGAALASGVYFVRAEQGRQVDTAKVLLVK